MHAALLLVCQHASTPAWSPCNAGAVGITRLTLQERPFSSCSFVTTMQHADIRASGIFIPGPVRQCNKRGLDLWPGSNSPALRAQDAVPTPERMLITEEWGKGMGRGQGSPWGAGISVECGSVSRLIVLRFQIAVGIFSEMPWGDPLETGDYLVRVKKLARVHIFTILSGPVYGLKLQFCFNRLIIF